MLLNEIPEYNEIIKEIRHHKRVLSKSKRKLGSIKKKYQFVDRLIEKGSSGQYIERQIAELFKSLDYKETKHITFPKNMPDIEITVANRLTCIEVKSIKNSYLEENEILQVHKYRIRRQDDLPNMIVKGILILNHDNEQIDIKLRNKTPFDSHRERDAKLNGYSLISTVELLNGFMLVKKNEITLSEFDKVIHQTGIIKFSKRHIKKVLNEE